MKKANINEYNILEYLIYESDINRYPKWRELYTRKSEKDLKAFDVYFEFRRSLQDFLANIEVKELLKITNKAIDDYGLIGVEYKVIETLGYIESDFDNSSKIKAN